MNRSRLIFELLSSPIIWTSGYLGKYNFDLLFRARLKLLFCTTLNDPFGLSSFVSNLHRMAMFSFKYPVLLSSCQSISNFLSGFGQNVPPSLSHKRYVYLKKMNLTFLKTIPISFKSSTSITSFLSVFCIIQCRIKQFG